MKKASSSPKPLECGLIQYKMEYETTPSKKWVLIKADRN